MIARHLAEHNRHLLCTQRASLGELLREAAQNLSIAPAEPDTVEVVGCAALLLIGGLERIDHRHGAGRPRDIGCEFQLNEGLGFCVHREKSIANSQTKSTVSCNYFEKSFG